MDNLNIPQVLIEKLSTAKKVVALTGAGISAESNIPTFRDAQTGLWARYRAEELATPEAFLRDPELVWRWYTWRGSLVAEAAPNPGHYALVALANLVPDFILITQNVDGLHQRAGSSGVVELHGNLSRTRCFDGCGVVPEWEDEGIVPPQCPHCGGRLRPDVVWFGETLPVDAVTAATQATQDCDLFLSIGTSALVYPAAGLIIQAGRQGAFTVEINLQATDQSQALDCAVHGPAGRILPELVKRAWPEAHDATGPA